MFHTAKFTSLKPKHRQSQRRSLQSHSNGDVLTSSDTTVHFVLGPVVCFSIHVPWLRRNTLLHDMLNKEHVFLPSGTSNVEGSTGPCADFAGAWDPKILSIPVKNSVSYTTEKELPNKSQPSYHSVSCCGTSGYDPTKKNFSCVGLASHVIDGGTDTRLVCV